MFCNSDWKPVWPQHRGRWPLGVWGALWSDTYLSLRCLNTISLLILSDPITGNIKVTKLTAEGLNGNIQATLYLNPSQETKALKYLTEISPSPKLNRCSLAGLAFSLEFCILIKLAKCWSLLQRSVIVSTQ